MICCTLLIRYPLAAVRDCPNRAYKPQRTMKRFGRLREHDATHLSSGGAFVMKIDKPMSVQVSNVQRPRRAKTMPQKRSSVPAHITKQRLARRVQYAFLFPGMPPKHGTPFLVLGFHLTFYTCFLVQPNRIVTMHTRPTYALSFK